MNLLITTLLILVSVTAGRSSLRGADDKPRRSLVTLTYLNNTIWQATELAYNAGTTAQPIDRTYPITLNFNSSRMSGSNGCNRYFGSYEQLSENSFSTGSFASTRKYCAAVSLQERNYMTFLRDRIFFYEVDTVNGTLKLYDAYNKTNEEYNAQHLVGVFNVSDTQ